MARLTRLLLLGPLLGGALLLPGCTTQAVDQAAGGSSRFVEGTGSSYVAPGHRKAAPDITADTLEGRRLSLSSLRGKVVALNIWASWCAPCQAEAPFLEGVSQDTAADGVVVLGVLFRDSPANGLAFQRKHGITYASLVDADNTIPARFRELPPSGVPSTLIIDREGRVAMSFPRPVIYSELKAAVERIAGETS